MFVCVTGGLRLSIASALNTISGAVSSGVPFTIIVTRDAVCHAPSSTSTSTSDPSMIPSMGVSWSEVSLEETIHDQSPSSSSSFPSASSIVHDTILSLIQLWRSQEGLCQSMASADLLHNLRAAYFLDISGAVDMPTMHNPYHDNEVLHKSTARQNILNLRMLSSLDDDMIIRGKNKNKQSSNISVAVGAGMPLSQELRSRISQAQHSRFKIQVLDQCMRCLICALSGLASSVAAFPMIEQVEPIKWLQNDISRALDAQMAYPIFSADRRGDSENALTSSVALSSSSSSSSPVPSTTAIAAEMLVKLVSMVNQSTQHCIGR